MLAVEHAPPPAQATGEIASRVAGLVPTPTDGGGAGLSYAGVLATLRWMHDVMPQSAGVVRELMEAGAGPRLLALCADGARALAPNGRRAQRSAAVTGTSLDDRLFWYRARN